MFAIMVFTEADKIATKFLRENKQYGAKRFLTEFPSKRWSLSGLKRLINKIDETGSTAHATGQVPDDRGRRDAMTTSIVLSSLR